MAAPETHPEPAGAAMRALAAVQMQRVNELNRHIAVLEEHMHQLLTQKPANEALCAALSSAIWALRMDAHSDQQRVNDMRAIAEAMDKAEAAGSWAAAVREAFLPEGGAA